ncbi:MAG TPA: Cd(II)/Pb(II)-responsive transcriptional regulator, partial [Marinobacter hydrocarbonoclasticus]|nr:Cd(II)/Pb(II)-responsive transcriptional regulator [Marinobacter nauticus]
MTDVRHSREYIMKIGELSRQAGV